MLLAVAVGLTGGALMIELVDEVEVQPLALVTVKVYVLAVNPLNVPVVPLPFIVAPPGAAVTVQFPTAGKPLKATLPVVTVQVGWVIVPIIGGLGLTKIGAILKPALAVDVQLPLPAVTV